MGVVVIINNKEFALIAAFFVVIDCLIELTDSKLPLNP